MIANTWRFVVIRTTGMWRDLVTVVTAVTAGDVSAQISPAQEDHSDHGLTAAELTRVCCTDR